jgi:glycosyltransferase involved in cell wall biosynthesis
MHSITIPVHNESDHLENSISHFISELRVRAPDLSFEILIVENGSIDNTLEVCQRLESKYPDRVNALSIPRGSYGEAIKHGILNSQGRYVTILECDLLSVDYLLHSREILENTNASFSVASKQHPDSVDDRPYKRRLLTTCFNYLLNFLVGYPGKDTHGLKTIDKVLAQKLADLSITTDEILQTEIVLIAWRLGYLIAELPVNIMESRPTPVPILKRLPMVMNAVLELRRSLRRFPRDKLQTPIEM